MLKIGMVSYWNPFHADEFAKGLAHNPGAQVAWVWDDDEARGRAWADKLGVPFYPGLDAALADGGADGVVLNCHPEQMAPCAVKAAQAGKHILVDKIVAVGQAQRDALEAALAGKALCFGTALALLRRPYFQTAKAMIDAGTLGRIGTVRMREAHGGLSGGGLPKHFTHNVPGGIFSDMGFHALYAMPWLLGQAPQRVSITAGDFCGTGAIDNGAYQLQFPGGALGTMEASYASGGSPFALEVYGTEACLLVGGPAKGILLGQGGAWRPVDPLPATALPEDDWVAAIQAGRQPEHGLETGLVLSRRFEALCRALDTGLPAEMA